MLDLAKSPAPDTTVVGVGLLFFRLYPLWGPCSPSSKLPFPLVKLCHFQAPLSFPPSIGFTRWAEGLPFRLAAGPQPLLRDIFKIPLMCTLPHWLGSLCDGIRFGKESGAVCQPRDSPVGMEGPALPCLLGLRRLGCREGSWPDWACELRMASALNCCDAV